ncbi:hypothetical protein ZWY2020_003263 [Hordeum vulgare]|nr:hypothetical protein ZWY2020_003258 [Hordeum vulgare]KAI4972338.1 hypothetical protein ZWY2020_003263 [Hordeum vulgare]
MKTLTYVLALCIATTTLLFNGGKSCTHDPVLTIEAACHQVSKGQPMLDLCTKTLHAAPNLNPNAVSTFAYTGSASAIQSSVNIVIAIRQLLQNPSLPKQLRATYNQCIERYGVAHKKNNAIGQALYSCNFSTFFKRDCTDAVAAIDDCTRNLHAVDPSSPLFKLALTGRDLTTITCSLALLGEAGH